jgi:hypothetical protein
MEALSIAASVIGSPGTDLILADLVDKGMKAGVPTRVKTGLSMSVGDGCSSPFLNEIETL